LNHTAPGLPVKSRHVPPHDVGDEAKGGRHPCVPWFIRLVGELAPTAIGRSDRPCVGCHRGGHHDSTMTDDIAARDTDAAADHVLDRYRTFAVVGASPRSWRPSHRVMQVLAAHGYDVIPVNPRCDEVDGRPSHPDLASAAADNVIEVVDIFRRSELAGAHVDEAIAIGAKAIWMQLGVIDHAAAQRARDAGLVVVMDRCPAIELRRRAA
jgi:predicted CoA-binding protein